MSKLQITHFVAIMCGLISGHGFIGYFVLHPSPLNIALTFMDLLLMGWGYYSFRWEITELRAQAINRRMLAEAGRFEDIRRQYMEDLQRRNEDVHRRYMKDIEDMLR